ncbi:hypothetical protein CFE70_004603 [Pyrenophora teres f. teres 0-1]|uniref:dihydroneopterin aldolase n=2 Tax=Pyrenophora teres f. teres TaxID=97479 RepID=E3RID7_PYRTT|nr:hypothetical protein PTT_07785 [Pyrenophora teres f. teres 0-1]KAE8833550.1 hypothetical protein HRS9139_05369 [Pyrenophora teres f. teres]KAE8840682.1 hypothetical protein PTNB85_04081 [Pyrenophora teres f. teres]KAE8849179.1 hypothetical protein HRS9122_03195 [Pyrenophora teres f. teres]KAE8864177.1 hypothetical protein PTNB29_04141 [Pyrenophora teres f. teres]
MNMGSIVRQVQWDAEVAQSGHFDKIMVQNLEVIVPAGKDVWGREKKQRAKISVTLTLGKQFTSASSTDSVDDSTVHYGTLSKAIQARFKDDALPWMSTSALSAAISDSVRQVAGSTDIYALETDVSYPKGSMLGERAGHRTSIVEKSGARSNVLYLRNVRIPCLIGVNSNERLQKQPVNVDIWVDNVHESRVDDYPQLENLLFELISVSSFQTIESLLAWLVGELKQKFFTQEVDQDAWIRLRIGKPHAVPFADAPAVEITRPIRS